MKLFINSGICERMWNDNVKVQETSSNTITLSIPNYSEEQSRQKFINFIFSNIDDINEGTLEDDLLLKNISLVRKGKNGYNISPAEKFSSHHMYALLRSTAVVPDDIYIPASMKDKVQVIRRLRFIDDEADYGNFLSNVYLLKIQLKTQESLPVFMSYNKPNCLDRHYVFYKGDYDNDYYVIKNLRTYILLSKYNKDEYVSLSSLCE